MGDAYQIKDQAATYYLAFQVVGWADVFSRKIYRDMILDNLKYCRENKGLVLFAYLIMTNHMHCIMRSKEEKLSDIVRDFKKHTSRQIITSISDNV